MAIQCAAWKQCLITEEKDGKEKRENGKRYVVFLTMAVTVFGVFAGTYIKIQSDMTARMNTISSLESQIADLKADNDEAYKRIRMSVDLDSVREKALNELGMSYAKESQIIYYTVDNDDFMNQYSEIPQK